MISFSVTTCAKDGIQPRLAPEQKTCAANILTGTNELPENVERILHDITVTFADEQGSMMAGWRVYITLALIPRLRAEPIKLNLLFGEQDPRLNDDQARTKIFSAIRARLLHQLDILKEMLAKASTTRMDLNQKKQHNLDRRLIRDALEALRG